MNHTSWSTALFIQWSIGSPQGTPGKAQSSFKMFGALREEEQLVNCALNRKTLLPCCRRLSQNCYKRLLASSCLSVHQSVCLSQGNKSTPTGRIFMKSDFSGLFFFRKSLPKTSKFDHNLSRITGTLHEYPSTFVTRWMLLSMKKCVSQSFRENEDTHIFFNKCSRKSLRLWHYVEIYGAASQDTDYNRKFFDLHAV